MGSFQTLQTQAISYLSLSIEINGKSLVAIGGLTKAFGKWYIDKACNKNGEAN